MKILELLATALVYTIFAGPPIGIFLCMYSVFNHSVEQAIIGQALIFGSIAMIWIGIKISRYEHPTRIYNIKDYKRKK